MGQGARYPSLRSAQAEDLLLPEHYGLQIDTLCCAQLTQLHITLNLTMHTNCTYLFAWPAMHKSRPDVK